MLEIARLNIKKAADTQRRYYNLRRRNWYPEIGELVYVKEHHLSVTDFVSPTIVKVIEEGKEDKSMIIHVKDLKEIPQ
uniref:Uncharacterized protein n=1 Tax=Megaselia scalaris TaxID=36166 RepID=T1GYT2_MEGSC